MNKLIAWVRLHQITTFYILVFGVSWFFLTLAFWVFPKTLPLQAIFGKLYVFSPALIALSLSAIANPKPQNGNGRLRWLVFTTGWLFSWLVLVLNVRLVLNVNPDMGLVSALGLCALLPAGILSSAYSRIRGVREHFSTLLNPRGPLLWYGVALFTFPLLLLAGAGITFALGGDVSFHVLGFGNAITLPLIYFLEGFVASGGINEESGWRGFVLPRLQARYSVITASLIVWFFWALWHLPYDIAMGTPAEQIIFNRLFLNLLVSILFTWVYNRTKGSLLSVALFHAAMNTSSTFLPVTLFAVLLLTILVIFAVAIDRMWKKLPAGNFAVYDSGEQAVD